MARWGYKQVNEDFIPLVRNKDLKGRTWKLVCPKCKIVMSAGYSGHHCSSCGMDLSIPYVTEGKVNVYG